MDTNYNIIYYLFTFVYVQKIFKHRLMAHSFALEKSLTVDGTVVGGLILTRWKNTEIISISPIWTQFFIHCLLGKYL